MTLQATKRKVRDRAKAVIFLEAGLVLVTEDGVTWKLPGGKIDEGESRFWALVRELREEINCELHSCAKFGKGKYRGRNSNGRKRTAHVSEALVAGIPTPGGEILDVVVTWDPQQYLLDDIAAQVVDELIEQDRLPEAAA